MDFESLSKWLSSEIAVLAHVSFWIVIGLVFLGLNKAFSWRYSGTINRLENDLSWARSQLERDADTRHAQPIHALEAPMPPPAMSPAPAAAVGLSEPAQEAEEERVYVPAAITLERLIALRAKASGIQADRQIASFVGKWIPFDETVKDIGLNYGEAFVRVLVGEHASLRDTFAHQVTFWFKDIPPQLELMEAGDNIKGLGQITDIGSLGLIVSRCELS